MIFPASDNRDRGPPYWVYSSHFIYALVLSNSIAMPSCCCIQEREREKEESEKYQKEVVTGRSSFC
jgi:hypothetical protein